MELVQIETSRVILLTEVHRPVSASYLPEVVAKVIQRYGFVQYPTAEQLLKNEVTFSMGKFGDAGIGEMKIYNDGVIVTSRSATEILEAFLIDLLAWIKDEFGIVAVSTVKPEWHFESMIVVKADTDLLGLMRPQKTVAATINQTWESYHSGQYQPVAMTFNIDPADVKSRRKPLFFTVERRVGVPFEDNAFYSVAPFQTKDHLAALTRLEDLARG